MTYKESLKCWAIVRTFSDRRIVVDRFRSRSDAEGHAQILRQRFPRGLFTVLFDCNPQEQDSPDPQSVPES